MISRPQTAEAAPYYFTYINQVTGDDPVGALENQLEESQAFFSEISEEKSLHRYAPEKWSIRQVLNHVTDTERAFAFRALWFARGFESPLPSYDQNVAASGAEADLVSWAAHVEEFRRVRLSTISLFRNMPSPAWDAKRHRQRQSLHRTRPALHHPGTLCSPRLGAARAILVGFQGEPVRLVNINSTDVRGTLVKIEGLSQDRVWSSLQRILEDTALCAFATVTTDNRAHVNTAYFAYSDELEVYFLSHPNSAHCRNVSGNASMAIAVSSSSQNWVGPDRGAQLFGFCNRAEDSETSKAEEAYIRRFPKYADWKKGLAPGDPALEYCLFRFATNRLKILDEGEFGEAIFVHADVVGLRSDLRHSHG